ncbi:MAG: signal peptide peptidase SppA [Chromatiales bacterium]|nr:signal peptide peptidase SppA [Chromatiales bacterium]
MFGKEGNSPGHGENWERELLERLSTASLNEQRRSRRWNIFFKFLIFGYLFMLVLLAMQDSEMAETSSKAREHVAMVEVNGMISDATKANADRIIEGLRDAFDNDKVKAIVLRINSPGGSPVQSDYVYREIKRLREKHKDIPVHAVIVDVGASGAYYIASAADNIYVNPSSIVGSIGVLMNGFGFTGAMEKLGVERRLLTAGESKGMLDPFTPLNKDEVKHVKSLLNDIHHHFIEAVKEGRGERLKSDKNLFTGMFWTGSQSIELGLADAIGDVDYVAREVIQVEDVVDYSPKPDFLKRFADRLGASMANVLADRMQIDSLALH